MIPTEDLTKVVNFIKRRQGDGEQNRLLAALQLQFPYRINHIFPIRSHVFKIDTTKGSYILKGYSSYSRLKLQETFTSSLLMEGFTKTYQFIQFNQEPIIYNNQYFGCLPYIQPHHQPFTFENEKDRIQGIDLLEEYHHVTTRSINRYQTILPEFDLINKWTERYHQFSENIQAVATYVPKVMIHEWLRWAEWSLAGMKANYIKERDVILHGDVAHHNFLRKMDGDIILIDFDLISIGSRNIDLLQYANRILPFVDWDQSALFRYLGLRALIANPFYLYALVYPTDLFREWNRLLKDTNGFSQQKLHLLKHQSFNKLHLRRQFNEKIITQLT
ncbi:phosphotransferase [Pseudoneobacillus sp. C159]